MNLDAFDQAKKITALEVAERYAGIKPIRKGKAILCNCVFHNDKHPSMHFFEETGSFYCWGCQAGGTSIDFVMALFRIDKHSAVKKIIEDFYDGNLHEQKPRAERAVTYKDLQSAVNRSTGIICSYLHYIEDRLDEMNMDDDLDASLLIEREKLNRLLDELEEQNEVIEQLRLLMPFQDRIVQMYGFLHDLPESGGKRYMYGVLCENG